MAIFGSTGVFASRRAMSLAALVCIAAILVCVNVVAARWLNYRWDLTSNRLYTLSRGTKDTLSKVDEPITLRFYYSTRLGETLPSFGIYAQRVRELLDQYVTAGHGKLRLEVYNPQPFSDVEDRAVALGLQAVPLNTEGEQVYFGVAGINSTDDQQVISFFAPDRERFLEYDLTKLIHSLAFPKKTVVGLMTALPLEGDMMAVMQGKPMRPMAVLDQLNQLNRVDTIAPTAEAIPPGVDVLMLVHPQNLSDRTLFAIDQFVLRGGKLLAFVDPYSELQAGSGQGPGHGNSANQPKYNSDLDRLLQRWGLRLLPNVVAGDRRDARRVSAPSGRGTQAMDYIAWINLRADNLNHDDVITADLSHVAMATPGILEPVPGTQTKVEPLITTSAESTKIPVEKVKGLPDVASLLAQFRPDDKRYILAARVTGMAQTAFPDGQPKPPEKPAAKPGEPADEPPEGAGGASPHGDTAKPAAETKPVEALKQSAQPINVIVVADSDMLDDRFWAQSQDFYGQRVIVPTANNGDFVANAIDVLAGGQDLVDLRSRGTSVRPFELVANIQRAADDRYAAEQQKLQQQLKDTQAKLRELTGNDPNNANAPLSAEQTKTIDEFRVDLLKTRQQLRAVQAALRGDIDDLKAVLEFCNIALIPIIVAIVALVLGGLRLKRRRRRPALA